MIACDARPHSHGARLFFQSYTTARSIGETRIQRPVGNLLSCSLGIVVHGSTAKRRVGRRADYILRYTRDFPIAVVEAKCEDEHAATGLQQAKDYAEILKLKFVYATNGHVQGKRRVLLTMATGTGKTVVAFHICWKLWSSKWNAKGDPTRKPYLADPNFLVDDPKDKIFAAFGDARGKIEGGIVTYGRELYFSTYQSIAKDANRPGLYKEFAPDFVDLVIVDECHRG